MASVKAQAQAQDRVRRQCRYAARVVPTFRQLPAALRYPLLAQAVHLPPQSGEAN